MHGMNNFARIIFECSLFDLRQKITKSILALLRRAYAHLMQISITMDDSKTRYIHEVGTNDIR
jgi:hypothetical protein